MDRYMGEDERSSRVWCHHCFQIVFNYYRTWLLKRMGVYLSTPRTEKVTEDGENEMLRYGLSSMQGWRSTMEDAHAAYSKLDASTSFFGVYDGHGGKDVAKFCAKHLHQQVLEYEAEHGDLGTSVRQAFLRMDERMLEIPGQKELASEGPTSGCTACVAIIRDDSILVANAGDSRCVLSRKGQAADLSKDHKPNLADEKQRILDAGGFIHFGRVNGCLNLSRAIGDMEMKRNKSLAPDKQIVTADPDIITVKLSEDDEFLIIACDGIWDCMSSQEAVDFVREQLDTESNLSVVCGKVLDRCLAPSSGGTGCDNMTMILVQFKRPSSTKPSCDPEQETGSSTQ